MRKIVQPEMKNIPFLTEKAILDLERSILKFARSKHAETGLPLVTLKFAQTLDGKIATLTGDSRWISGTSSLKFAHRMRGCHDAILVGVNTIIRDDPRLTVRLVKGKDPLKVVVDSRLRIPPSSNVLQTKASSTIIATTSLSSRGKIKRLQTRGACVWLIRKDRSNRVDLKSLLQKLGEKDIRSVLVEGGSTIITSFLKKQLADQMVVVIAPKIVGKGINWMNSAFIPRGFKISVSFFRLKFFRSDDDVILQTFIG